MCLKALERKNMGIPFPENKSAVTELVICVFVCYGKFVMASLLWQYLRLKSIYKYERLCYLDFIDITTKN